MRMESIEYYDYVLSDDSDLIQEIQADCAALAEKGPGSFGHWATEDGERIAAIFNRSKNPRGLFRFMDERTGSSYVGYRTRDGREWFHILRQMRNTPGSGLLENLGREAA